MCLFAHRFSRSPQQECASLGVFQIVLLSGFSPMAASQSGEALCSNALVPASASTDEGCSPPCRKRPRRLMDLSLAAQFGQDFGESVYTTGGPGPYLLCALVCVVVFVFDGF